MPKSDLPFTRGEYATVAERITAFYKAFPRGRIIADLLSHEAGRVIVKASVFRGPDDTLPAATGLAAEREDDGEINVVACIENTETSAIGRALANLGFAASSSRPSAEEMAKAERARERLRSRTQEPPPVRGVSEPPPPPAGDALQHRADAAVHVLLLVDAAEREGLRPRRATRLRERLRAKDTSPEELSRIRHQLRNWLERQRSRRFASMASGSPPAPDT